MPLFIINKRTQVVERPLIRDEESNVIAFFIEKTDRSRVTKSMINALCGDLYQRDVWLQCRCIAHGMQYPVVHFNLSQSTRYYVRRIHSRGAHAESYKARKKRTQLRAALGPVFVFDAITHDEKGNLEPALKDFKAQLQAALC